MVLQKCQTRKNTSRAFALVSVVLLLNYISIALIDANSSVIYCGYFYGSLFTHSVLSATWAALGPGTVRLRLPLAIVWVVALLVAPVANFVQYAQLAYVLELTYWYGAILFAQWLVIQVVALPLIVKVGVCISSLYDTRAVATAETYPPKILHFLVFATLVAAYCGLGRLLGFNDNLAMTLATEISWALGATLTSIPLLITSLMQRSALRNTLFCLILLVIGTYVEFSLMSRFRISGSEFGAIIATNSASAVLTLTIACIMRLHGFRLLHRQN